MSAMMRYTTGGKALACGCDVDANADGVFEEDTVSLTAILRKRMLSSYTAGGGNTKEEQQLVVLASIEKQQVARRACRGKGKMDCQHRIML